MCQQVLTLDVAPSVLDLCGAPALEKILGRSWRALANDGDPAWRTAWFYEPSIFNRALTDAEMKRLHEAANVEVLNRWIGDAFNFKARQILPKSSSQCQRCSEEGIFCRTKWLAR